MSWKLRVSSHVETARGRVVRVYRIGIGQREQWKRNQYPFCHDTDTINYVNVFAAILSTSYWIQLIM